jgi:hypothetical protein
MVRQMTEKLGGMIDGGLDDVGILKKLVEEQGADILRPHQRLVD